ncbi:hypothetical protein B4100_0332 [Heyndrickxia coagulans]|nr:hypothetical protein B4100_0332 [Heyndrickxia coagulans]
MPGNLSGFRTNCSASKGEIQESGAIQKVIHYDLLDALFYIISKKVHKKNRPF